MEGYDASTYGDRMAVVYDSWHMTMAQDTRGAVAFLKNLAGAGPALELAIGTGRIALPLVAEGVEIHGIDASEAMVGKLRDKPGGEGIPVTMGDFADVGVDGSYRLAFVVFNTFFALLTQEDQIRCFRNVARHLTEDGAFVIEAFVPDMSRFDRDQRTETTSVDTTTAHTVHSVLDLAAQRIDSLLVETSEEGTKTYPVAVRFAWPSELDLMARLAGMRLRERFEDWHGGPFSSASPRHVSVYELDR